MCRTNSFYCGLIFQFIFSSDYVWSPIFFILFLITFDRFLVSIGLQLANNLLLKLYVNVSLYILSKDCLLVTTLSILDNIGPFFFSFLFFIFVFFLSNFF